MTDRISAAHDALNQLFRGDEAPYANALEVTARFHEWAAANGYDVELTGLREKHVWGEIELDERYAQLTLEWINEH